MTYTANKHWSHYLIGHVTLATNRHNLKDKEYRGGGALVVEEALVARLVCEQPMSLKIQSLLKDLKLERKRRHMETRSREDDKAQVLIAQDENGLSEDELHKHMETMADWNFCHFYRDSYEQETLLHHGIAYGSLEYIRGLFKLGVPVEPQDDDGATALHYSAGYNQTTDYTNADDEIKQLAEDKIRILVAHGAELEVQDREGRTALAMAVEKGKYSVPSAIKTLLELKSDPMARSHDGLTLLHYAALSNHAATMQLVLDMASLRNPELRTLEAYTPLHYAGHISLPVLLCNGADMDVVTRKGVPPLQMMLLRHEVPAGGGYGYEDGLEERKEMIAVWDAEKDRRSLPPTHCFLLNPALLISSKHLQTR